MKNVSFALFLDFTGLFAPQVSYAQYVPENLLVWRLLLA